MMTSAKTKGFTLIELLVVISIIGVLASIVLAALTSTKVKANDAKKISTVRQVDTALKLYESNVGSSPGNFIKDGVHDPNGGGNMLACEDEDSPESFNAYTQSMNMLVTNGVYPEIPRSPDGKSYCYYDYGGQFGEGATFTSKLSDNNNFGLSSPSITLEIGVQYYFRFPSKNITPDSLGLRQDPNWVQGANISVADKLYFMTPLGSSYEYKTVFYCTYPGYIGWRFGTYTSVTLVPSEFAVISSKKNQSMIWRLPPGTIYYGSDATAAMNMLNDFNAVYYPD